MKIRKYKNGTISMSTTKGDKPGALLAFVNALAGNVRDKTKTEDAGKTSDTGDRPSQ